MSAVSCGYRNLALTHKQQLALFAEPAARRADRPTSRAAAEAQRPRASALEARILDVFATFGPLTDDELCDRIPDEHAPTVKTCRSRLSKRGLVVPTGATRPSTRGRAQTVWQIAGEVRAGSLRSDARAPLTGAPTTGALPGTKREGTP